VIRIPIAYKLMNFMKNGEFLNLISISNGLINMFSKRKIDIIKDKLKKKIKNADKQKRPNMLKQLRI